MNPITKDELIDYLKKQVEAECRIPYSEVNTDLEFVNFGMDSMQAISIMEKLEKYLNVELSALYFWEYPTIGSFSEFLCENVLNKSV
jgi:acyl carrier protein